MVNFAMHHNDVYQASDGSWIHFRLLTVADGDALQRGFQRLSMASRYRRFFTTKKALTAVELRYLTDLDQVNHVAVGAVEITADGQEGDVVGVARFIRLSENDPVAELAIAIVDSLHGRGVAQRLLERLCEQAQAVGVEHFQVYFLVENRQMRNVIQRLSGGAHFSQEGHYIATQFSVPTPAITTPRERSLIVLLAEHTEDTWAGLFALSHLATTNWQASVHRTLNFWSSILAGGDYSEVGHPDG